MIKEANSEKKNQSELLKKITRTKYLLYRHNTFITDNSDNKKVANSEKPK